MIVIGPYLRVRHGDAEAHAEGVPPAPFADDEGRMATAIGVDGMELSTPLETRAPIGSTSLILLSGRCLRTLVLSEAHVMS